MLNNCSPNGVCGDGYVDSSCTIYHLFNNIPTKLINLGISNGTSVQTILEAIDAAFGAIGLNNGPINPISTNAINLTATGAGNRTLTASLILASGATQIATILSTGLFVPDLRDWKVKVNALDFPDYLVNKVVGGTDGIVSLSAEQDPSGNNLVAFLPSLNVVALADDSAFISALTSNSQFQEENTVSVSPNSGNIIEQLSNGLYASGGTAFTVNNDINGNLLTANGTTTSINGQSSLTYLNGTLSAPMFNYSFQVIASQEFDRGLFATQLLLNAANFGVNASNLSGNHGQLFFNAGENNTFGRGHFIGGSIGELVLNSSGSTTSTGLASAVIGKVDVFNSDNYTQVASFRSQYPGTSSQFGGDYSGTITNYYGLFIGDTNANEGGISHSLVTNSYAIFQEGSLLLNSFATAVVVTSDERVKTNIEDFSGGLSIIENIDIVKFNFKENTTAPKKIGVIAQKVEKVLPEAIHTSKSDFYNLDDFKRLDNDVIVYILVNAVKELSAQNKTLNARLLGIEGKVFENK